MLRQRNMAQMKEQIKAPEKRTKQQGHSQPIRCKFPLVINMLTEMVEYGRKIEEKVKAVKSEIKENVQGTNNSLLETGTQINDLEQNEEINLQLEQNEEIGFQKNEERLRNLWDNFKCPNIQIIGVPEREEEEQEIENI